MEVCLEADGLTAHAGNIKTKIGANLNARFESSSDRSAHLLIKNEGSVE